MAETATKPIIMQKPAEARSFYELYMLLSTSATDKNITELENNVSRVLENSGAEITKKDKIVKRNLAYPIKGLESAYAGSIFFYSTPAKIANIKVGLNDAETGFLRLMIAKTSPEKLKARRTPKVKEADLERIHKKLEHATQEKVYMDTEPRRVSIKKPAEKKGKMSIEEIDKKLDEIMGNL
jgi:ribosomal protein S6